MTEKVTESDKIWDEIKDVKMALYGLPAQKVSEHAERLKLSPHEVHLRLKSSSVIASLEDCLNTFTDPVGNITRAHRYDIEQTENGYVIVKRPSVK
jgi:hypothetical protein